MTEAPVLLAIDARGVATATLNRPQVGNAYNEALLEALIESLDRLRADPGVRALVLRGAGQHFQAGADLNWLAQAAEYPPEQAFRASMATTCCWNRRGARSSKPNSTCRPCAPRWRIVRAARC